MKKFDRFLGVLRTGGLVLAALWAFLAVQLLHRQGREWSEHPLWEHFWFGLSVTAAGGLLFWMLPVFADPDRRPLWLRVNVWTALNAGVATGLLLFAGSALLRFFEPGGPPASQPVLLQEALLTGLLTPILEEIFFRGSLQRYFERNGLALWLTLLLPAVLVARVHAPNVRFFLFFVGFFFGVLFWRCGLVSAIVAHVTYNSLILAAQFSSD